MRFIKIPLLALGVVLGYGFAFHSAHHRHGREYWENHFADACVRAARAAKGGTVKMDNPKSESPPSTESSTESAEP